MTIPTISTLPTAPARTDPPATFVTRADSFLAALVVMQGELNTSIGQMNIDIASINDSSAAAQIALAAANFKGAWADLTGALDIPASVSHAGNYWLVLQDLPDVTASEPSAGNSDWEALPVIPSQTGNSGKFLTTDGTSTSWATLSLDPTLGTLTKTFLVNEQATISLSGTIASQIPTVSGTKEIAQTGVTTNRWNIDSTNDNYSLLDSAYDTTLDFFGDISSASYVQSFSFLSQQSEPGGVAFSTNGDKMFVAGDTPNAVSEYALSRFFDISSASFTQSFSVSGQEGQTQDLTFNPTGTKMFIVGSSGDEVNEYALSSAFDVSSASFTQNFSVSAQESFPTCIAFNTDGTKMFICGGSGADVNEYALSSGFDVSTASFTDNFSVSAQETSPGGLAFNSTGHRMFVTGSSGDDVNEYILSTGFDVSSASYSQNFSIATEESNPQGIAFNPTGEKMFIIGRTGNDVNEYSLSSSTMILGTGSFDSGDLNKVVSANDGQFKLTATSGTYDELTAPTSYAQSASGEWGMSALYYGNNTLILSGAAGNPDIANNSLVGSVSTPEAQPRKVKLSQDGTKMFMFASGTPDSVYQYSLSVPFFVSSAVYDGVSLNVSSQDINMAGFTISKDGLHVYAVGESSPDNVYQYDLSTPFDLSGATYIRSYSVGGQDTSPAGIEFNNDGSRMFIAGHTGDDINQYNLATSWDISTSGFNSSFSVASQSLNPDDVRFNTDGTKMYVMINDVLYQYSLSTPFQVNTASYDSVNFSFASQDTGTYGFAFSSDQKYLYVSGQANSKIFQHDVENTILLTGYQLAITKSSIDTTYWTDINSMTANDDAKDSLIYYSISSDDRTTWQVIDNANGVRDIVRNNAGTWQYNFDATYADETWLDGTTNTEEATLIEAMTIANNRMDKAQINGVSDANQITLTNNLDLAILFNADSGTKTPFSSGIEINYDANVLNESIVLGTDFNVDMPATDKVRVTAINAGNYKLRVV